MRFITICLTTIKCLLSRKKNLVFSFSTTWAFTLLHNEFDQYNRMSFWLCLKVVKKSTSPKHFRSLIYTCFEHCSLLMDWRKHILILDVNLYSCRFGMTLWQIQLKSMRSKATGPLPLTLYCPKWLCFWSGWKTYNLRFYTTIQIFKGWFTEIWRCLVVNIL